MIDRRSPLQEIVAAFKYYGPRTHFGKVCPGTSGGVWHGWTLRRALRLDEVCERLLPVGREDVPWATMAAVLVLARLIPSLTLWGSTGTLRASLTRQEAEPELRERAPTMKSARWPQHEAGAIGKEGAAPQALVP